MKLQIIKEELDSKRYCGISSYIKGDESELEELNYNGFHIEDNELHFLYNKRILIADFKKFELLIKDEYKKFKKGIKVIEIWNI